MKYSCVRLYCVIHKNSLLLNQHDGDDAPQNVTRNIYIVSRTWRGPLEQPKQWETENLGEFVDAICNLDPCVLKITWLKHTFLIWVLFVKVVATRPVYCDIDKERTHFPDLEQMAVLPVLHMTTVTCLPVCLSNCGLWGLSTVSRSSRSCLSELQVRLLLHRLPVPSHTVQGTNKTDSLKFT